MICPVMGSHYACMKEKCAWWLDYGEKSKCCVPEMVHQLGVVNQTLELMSGHPKLQQEKRREEQ